MQEDKKKSALIPPLEKDAYNPEQFKQATVGVIHALSGRKDTNINFYSGPLRNHLTHTTVTETTIHLPQPPPIHDPQALKQLRGTADAIALRLKYHNPKLHEHHQPEPGDAKTTFDALEQVRVEALGSRRMQGIAANLRAVIEYSSQVEGHARMNKAEQMPPQTALALLAREKLTGEPVPIESRKILQLWRDRLNKAGEKALEHMMSTIANQQDYAKAARNLLTAYKLMAETEESEDNSSNATDDQEQEKPETAPDNPTEEPPTPQEQPATEEQTPQMAEGTDLDHNPNAEEGDGFESQEQPAGPQDTHPSLLDTVEDAGYSIYTKEFDDIITADQLCSPEELDFLRQQLDQQLYHIQNITSKLANRLQRKLMAQQTRRWDFDLEEGMLDTSKLTKIIINPAHPVSYKQEKETDFKDTIVSLLIDNSGSMRGKPISIAAMCGDILARTLERCAVKVEILGFTTKTWKGGQSREKWLTSGRTPHPGRLNDLRHIIYKSADQPWRRVRRNLGLMLQEGLLKENIDGESLFWAWQRLRYRPERRKILMIISDGAPVDDSTLSANSPEYLESHLRRIITRIEARKEVELTAIGIGHDVTSYYKNAVTITNAEQLGGTMMQELTNLFDSKNSRNSHKNK